MVFPDSDVTDSDVPDSDVSNSDVLDSDVPGSVILDLVFTAIPLQCSLRRIETVYLLLVIVVVGNVVVVVIGVVTALSPHNLQTFFFT